MSTESTDTMKLSLDDLRTYAVDPKRGFLPPQDPPQTLPPAFLAWEQVARELPKLLVTTSIRRILDDLPTLDPSSLARRVEQERAMLLLSYLGHAYVWGEAQPSERIPTCISLPWHQVAHQVGRLPILSYASYALWNWKRIDGSAPIALGNIVLLQNFLGGLDEEWFILVHVAIEAAAAPAIAAIPLALAAARRGDVQVLTAQLTTVATALEQMNRVLFRMPEKCDPYIYFNRVRPYIHGWQNHPALPNGVVYEGVAEYEGKPQRFLGETGAQSSIIPALDALLGISHREGPLRYFLSEMRRYMPPEHRSFVATVEQSGSVRAFVQVNHHDHPLLRQAYNACVEQIVGFRSIHLGYAEVYIAKQAEKSAANPTQVGTGGTPFVEYLSKHRDESGEHVL